MSTTQIYLTLGVFAVVVLLIALDWCDMVVAALLGVCALSVLGILKRPDVAPVLITAGGPLALLFGGMIVAGTLSKTGLFDRLGNGFLRATGGSGKRFLLLLMGLVVPTCALLPNATTVVLLAPVIIRVALALEADFVGPMILTAILSNSAGLLTLVGDPATFLVGSSIGMSFGTYLRTVSLGGLLSVLVVLPTLPLLMPELWRLQRPLPPVTPSKPLEHPWFTAFALATLAVMVALFLFGESMPTPIVPPIAAIIGSALALLAVYGAKIEPVDNVLRDVDWKTLLFLGAIFFLVEGVTKTGLLRVASLKMESWFGTNLILVAFGLLAGLGPISGLLANIPVVAASILMTKGYLVAAALVPEEALAAGFTDWPRATIPVFVAMMFAATLGGNLTLIGASANIASAGACAKHGRRITFGRFLRFGLPIGVLQLLVSGLYVYAMFRLSR